MVFGGGGGEMKNKQILKRVIEKALKHKWNALKEYRDGVTIKDFQERRGYFSHDFCKAFFGTKILDIRDLGFEPITNKTKTVAWKFHLLALVLCKKRLKYLEKYL